VVPTSGRAFLAGVDVAAHPALAKQLSGIVSQQNTLDRQLTVWENLYFHGRLFGMGAKASRKMVITMPVARTWWSSWARGYWDPCFGAWAYDWPGRLPTARHGGLP
jgi:hypothetical protein